MTLTRQELKQVIEEAKARPVDEIVAALNEAANADELQDVVTVLKALPEPLRAQVAEGLEAKVVQDLRKDFGTAAARKDVLEDFKGTAASANESAESLRDVQEIFNTFAALASIRGAKTAPAIASRLRAVSQLTDAEYNDMNRLFGVLVNGNSKPVRALQPKLKPNPFRPKSAREIRPQ